MPSRRALAPDDVLALDPSVEIFVAEDGVVGVGPTGAFALDGVDVEGLRATLDLVDGRRTVAEVARALADRWDAGDVGALLAQLDGVVLQRSDLAPIARSFSKTRVAVLGSGVMAASIATELRRHGFDAEVMTSLPTTSAERPSASPAVTPLVSSRARSEPVGVDDLAGRLERAAVVVCALEGVQGRTFLDVDAAATKARRPALFVWFARGAFHVGPLHVPGRSPCFACAQLSTTLKDVFETSGPSIVSSLAFGVAPSDSPGAGLSRVASEVRQEVVRVVVGTPYPARLGSVLSIMPSGDATSRRAHLVAACPACRGALGAAVVDETAAPAPLFARDPSSVCDSTGGSRSVPPDEAHRRALAAFARLDVDATCEQPPDDGAATLGELGCPFFSVAVQPRFRGEAPLVFPMLKGPCFGKGTTDLQARCSAFFEWFERNLADWRGDRDLVRAPWDRVRDRAIDMPFYVSGLLPGLPSRGLRPFDPAAPMDWVWGHCLRRNEPILVPAASVFLCGTMFLGGDFDIPRAGSSGLSAGCSPGDAALQGLLEIVERDATFTAIRNGVTHPAIDGDTVEEPEVRALLERIRDAGYDPRLRDITSTIGVPTIEAYLVKRGEYGNHFAMGYGAHLDARVALRRAVTEAVQTLNGCAETAELDPLRADSSYFEVFPHRQQALRRRGPARPSESGTFASRATSSVWAQIDEVVTRIVAANPRADVCAVDLSLPELQGVHVVRTLVTGMLDEARGIQLHVPARCRLRPLDEMYLGRIAM